LNPQKPVIVGKIIKSFGLKGEVKVYPEIYNPNKFYNFKKLIIYTRLGEMVELEVENVRPGAGGTLLIKFKGINTREQADSLKSLYLYVKRKELDPLPEGEYYFCDLEGLKVKTKKGKIIGKVFYIHRYVNFDVFEVRDEKDEIVMIPITSRFVKKIDLENGEIIVEI